MTACRTLARLGLNRLGMSGDRKLQAVQLAGRDHADQRRLGPLATLEQPLGEVGPRAESGDRDVDGAGPGVPVPVAVGEVTRSGELVPYSAPQTASASANIYALITVVSRSHIRSGDAADRPLSSSWGGENLPSGHRDGPLQSAVDGSLELSRGGRVYVPATCGATITSTAIHHYQGLNCNLTPVRVDPLCGTRLATARSSA